MDSIAQLHPVAQVVAIVCIAAVVIMWLWLILR